MYFSKENSQYLVDKPIFGKDLRKELISFGVIEIPAGTVMVYHKRRPLLLFQLLETISVECITDASFLPYEEGSLVFMGGFAYMPTLKFSLCTLPRATEMLIYDKALTV